MSQSPTTTVRIFFESPVRQHPLRPPTIHERRIENVPWSIAKQMEQDFEAHEARSPDPEWQPVREYRYGGGDQNEPMYMRLDFRTVIAVTTMEVASDSATERVQRQSKDRVQAPLTPALRPERRRNAP
jgi:hypothetical protein